MTGKDSVLGRSTGAWGRQYLQQGQQHQQGQGGQAHHAHPGDLQSLGILGDQLRPGSGERTCQEPPEEPNFTFGYEGGGVGEGQGQETKHQDSEIRERAPGQRCWGMGFSLGTLGLSGLWELCSEEGRCLTLAPTAPGKPGGPAGPVGPCE